MQFTIFRADFISKNALQFLSKKTNKKDFVLTFAGLANKV